MVVYYAVLFERLLICWFCGFVPKSLNYIGLDPFMSWGRVCGGGHSTTVFLRNEFLPHPPHTHTHTCGKRALPKCHCAFRTLERVQLVNLVQGEFIEAVLGFILTGRARQ